MTLQYQGERQKPPRNCRFGHTSGLLAEGGRVAVQPCAALPLGQNGQN